MVTHYACAPDNPDRIFLAPAAARNFLFLSLSLRSRDMRLLWSRNERLIPEGSHVP